MAAQNTLNSREYKVMVDHRLFVDRKSAALGFWRDVSACAKRLPITDHSGSFDEVSKREIVFLDTPDRTIAHNGFVFRQRREVTKGRAEYTLKCRSPDRFVASCADVSAADDFEVKHKLEEDIAAPFISRYSNSNTIRASKQPPRNLHQASRLFPVLGELSYDGRKCSDKIRLKPTSSHTMFERVLSGPTLTFGKIEAEVALILWSDGAAGRPLVAEFSFRYTVRRISGAAPHMAMEFFLKVQALDWCLPESRTKTQYIYES